MTQKKTSQTSPLQRAAMGVKQPFFSKKCIFRAENDIFLKNSFYSKFISDQKYIICTFWKKKFFTKIMILYFSPNLTYLYIILSYCILLILFCSYCSYVFDVFMPQICIFTTVLIVHNPPQIVPWLLEASHLLLAVNCSFNFPIYVLAGGRARRQSGGEPGPSQDQQQSLELRSSL